jgi:tRNA (guanine37-N1)-methyltransferase
MVFMCDPLVDAVEAVEKLDSRATCRVLLTPQGEPLRQSRVEWLAKQPRLLLIAGHYEGIDERVRATFVHQEISIGDYVLTGGELAAMVVIDAVARYVDGVIKTESVAEESHSDGLLEYPHYTRPANWEGQEIPAVLASGHHGDIATWRRQQRLLRTLQRRPDMLATAPLSRTDKQFLATHGYKG